MTLRHLFCLHFHYLHYHQSSALLKELNVSSNCCPTCDVKWTHLLSSHPQRFSAHYLTYFRTFPLPHIRQVLFPQDLAFLSTFKSFGISLSYISPVRVVMDTLVLSPQFVATPSPRSSFYLLLYRLLYCLLPQLFISGSSGPSHPRRAPYSTC